MLAVPGQWAPRTSKAVCLRARNQLRRRQYAALAQLPNPGDNIHGFTVQRTKHVPELELTALHLQHDKTGAEYLHVARDDKNNVFSIGFKTNPPDATGVPHILEHLVLCGSEKYPVRDPFFKMMPRSLQNFMNAMTYPDHTVYPFATTNPQDFKNLMSVYMDATLHPLLKPHDFAQEGWRVGPADVENKDSEFLFKGVVYNEMKGVMSSADSLFLTKWQDHVFPAIKNSGGMPDKITDLTHTQLKNFHADHYHPSNAKIFTYGDTPLSEHLQEIGAQLNRFDKIAVDHDIKLPITLKRGIETVTVQGPVDPLFPTDQQYKASLSWMMCDTAEVLETFSLSVISSLLLEGFSSPLYQNTIEIGWGASYTPNTGLDASAKTAIFSVGLSGLKRHDVSRLPNGIKNTLESVRRSGFDLAKVEGQLHQIELAMKHKTAHFGMGLMSRLQDGWFNGVDPMSTVAPVETIAAFKEKIKEPGYLEGLLDKYWLQNKMFNFVMEPERTFEQGILDEEATRLKGKITEISQKFGSDEEVRKVLEKQEIELQEVQENAKNENVDCLPTLHVRDITRQIERKPIRYSTMDDTKVQWREAPTNGLTYLRGIYTFQDLPDDLRVYLPLFSSAIQRLGTKTLSIEKIEDLIKLRTGGIDLGHHSATSPSNLDVCEEGIAFSSYALDRNVPHMYELLRTLVQETNFDHRNVEKQISELIKSSASSAVNDIADAGSAYAQRFVEAGISAQGRLNEQMSGLTQVRLMMDLAARGDQAGLADVIDRLKAIQQFALTGGASLRVALTCSPESSSSNEAALQRFLSQLPSGVTPPTSDSQMAYPRDTKSFFPLPYQVYYTASALRTVPYTHADSSALRILAELLTHKRVHHEIREKGGAYGGSAYSASLRGVFGFSSYRDPNPLNSLKVMNEAGAWARNRTWTDRDLEEAKLSVFQGLDAPKSVSAEGMTKFLTGVDEDMQQTHREQLLDIKAQDVNRVADEYLVKKLDELNVAVLGKKADWVNPEKNWLEMPMDVQGGSGSGEQGEGSEDGYLII